MSYLSTSENVGFSAIPQNMSDASCATQYKMAVESVSGSCGGDMNIFLHENSGEEQAYLPNFNDNFFHSKFKIDSNELYTFQDSDIIAGEITVCHTEDNFIFTEGDEVQDELLHSPNAEPDISSSLTNGILKEDVPNGHYTPVSITAPAVSINENKTINTKASKAKTQNQAANSVNQNQIVKNDIRNENQSQTNSLLDIHQAAVAKSLSNNVIISSNNSTNNSNQARSVTTPKQSGVIETFLDVFKREQGVHDNSSLEMPEISPVLVKTVKTESAGLLPPAKIPVPTPKKTPVAKSPSHTKVRRGRGPAVHEALQRIPVQSRVIPILNRTWHAPGEELFECGPLDDKHANQFRQVESGSSDDDYMPNFETGSGPVCVEESAAESRGARLALRRAALRRHVAKADIALQYAKDYQTDRALASLIKKQLSSHGHALPTQMVNHLLAMRGMSAVLTSQEHRKLRESGWSGGESGRTGTTNSTCSEDHCTQSPLPCARYCLAHITQAPEQRLYASCTAVFAGGERCKQALLPLQDQTLLCAEHAWKRDNYEKLTRDWRPRKMVRARPSASPRRAKRRKRPATKQRPLPTQNDVQPTNSLSDVNVCSNSSNCDSSEDTAMGCQSENEYVVITRNSQELEVGEVGHVPPDDILDPVVLSQIPDEAFTEFFNQAEGGTTFVEGSELAAALEAVLDERALDTIADCVFTQSPRSTLAKNKIQVSTTTNLETSPSTPS